jgi:hypothetical protein
MPVCSYHIMISTLLHSYPICTYIRLCVLMSTLNKIKYLTVTIIRFHERSLYILPISIGSGEYVFCPSLCTWLLPIPTFAHHGLWIFLLLSCLHLKLLRKWSLCSCTRLPTVYKKHCITSYTTCDTNKGTHLSYYGIPLSTSQSSKHSSAQHPNNIPPKLGDSVLCSIDNS